MSLIQAPTSTIAVERKTQAQISVEIMKTIAPMKRSAQILFDLIWNHPSLLPQRVCDLMGDKAAGAFDAHTKLQELILIVDPTWVALVPPVEYTKNDDGTVTVGE
jgi:hypothetical protein